MEKLSDVLCALQSLYDEEGDMKIAIRSGRNQRGEAVHRFRQCTVKEFESGRMLVFEAVDEPDLFGRR